MGMSQADVVAGGRPVVKGSMGMDDIDLDDDEVSSFYSSAFLLSCTRVSVSPNINTVIHTVLVFAAF